MTVDRAFVPHPTLIALLLLAGAAAGCGDGRPRRVPVSGRVLIDGKPLTLGYIRFVPDEGRPSGGDLGPDGRFRLTCYDGYDGAVVGTHRVEVAAREILGTDTLRWHAPKKYLQFDTSDVSVEIAGATDALQIDLTWDGGAPFSERFEGEPVLAERLDGVP